MYFVVRTDTLTMIFRKIFRTAHPWLVLYLLPGGGCSLETKVWEKDGTEPEFVNV
jgi:hypothetical protein